jgi:hypothetical protein
MTRPGVLMRDAGAEAEPPGADARSSLSSSISDMSCEYARASASVLGLNTSPPALLADEDAERLLPPPSS